MSVTIMRWLVRNYRAYFVAGLMCVLCITPCLAIEFQCPASVEVSEQLGNQPAPWEALVDQSRGGYQLDKVGFYSGHPKNKGTVVPDKTTRSKGLAKIT